MCNLYLEASIAHWDVSTPPNYIHTHTHTLKLKHRACATLLCSAEGCWEMHMLNNPSAHSTRQSSQFQRTHRSVVDSHAGRHASPRMYRVGASSMYTWHRSPFKRARFSWITQPLAMYLPVTGRLDCAPGDQWHAKLDFNWRYNAHEPCASHVFTGLRHKFWNEKTIVRLFSSCAAKEYVASFCFKYSYLCDFVAVVSSCCC